MFTIGDKVIEYISGIKKDIPRRCLAFFGFIIVGLLTVIAIVFDFFYRFGSAFVKEIGKYCSEIFPRIKSFVLEFIRLW